MPPGDPTPFDAFRVNSPASADPPPGGSSSQPVGPPATAPFSAAAPASGPDSASGEAGAEAEQPVPQVRNGRVLLAVLCAAVLLLVVPLGIVWLATRSSGPSFEVGSCVRRSGSEAVAAECDESGAFTVVSKVDSQDKCTDPPGQPYVVIADGGKESVLCLRPAGK
jgi:hypothetical protein